MLGLLTFREAGGFGVRRRSEVETPLLVPTPGETRNTLRRNQKR